MVKVTGTSLVTNIILIKHKLLPHQQSSQSPKCILFK